MDKEDVVHTCNGILHDHKNNEITPSAVTWMDPEPAILSKVKGIYHVILLMCGPFSFMIPAPHPLGSESYWGPILNPSLLWSLASSYHTD